MKSSTILLAFVFFLLHGHHHHVFAQNDSTTTTTTTPPPETTTVTTTISPDTTTTTTTTTEEPTTTTTKSTTTTTEEPTTNATTTTPSPSTTSAPTPAPPKWPHNIHLWNVVDKEKNITCIKLEGAFKLDVTYDTIDKKKANAGIDVPVSANSTGVCGKALQTIALTWDVDLSQNKTTGQNKLVFNFEVNDSSSKDVSPGKISPGKYALVNVTFLVYQDKAHFPNTSNIDKPLDLALNNLKFFETKLNHSYFCRSLEQFKNDGFGFEIEQSKIEAFRTLPSNATEFSAANVCKLDDTTDVVPIAIGASLAGLVVFILIIYLIGRRKSRARGYQSV